MENTVKKKPFYKTLGGTVIIIAALCVLLYWIFFGALSIFTKHGDVQLVPKIQGLSLDSALKVLDKAGFDYKVDSIYDKEYGLNEVVNQLPLEGAKVKAGRMIFLIVNKANPPLVEMPNLISKTYRTAEAALKKLGLSIGDTTMVYDLAEGTILEQRLKGNIIPPGTKVPEGSKIDLVIAMGLSDEQVNIPDLTGMKYPEAVKLLDEKGLHFTLVFDGKISDSASALVFSQYPESRNEYGEPLRLYLGDKIEVRVAQNPTIEKKKYISRPPSDKKSDEEEGANTNNTSIPSDNNKQQADKKEPVKKEPTIGPKNETKRVEETNTQKTKTRPTRN